MRDSSWLPFFLPCGQGACRRLVLTSIGQDVRGAWRKQTYHSSAFRAYKTALALLILGHSLKWPRGLNDNETNDCLYHCCNCPKTQARPCLEILHNLRNLALSKKQVDIVIIIFNILCFLYMSNCTAFNLSR